MACKRNNQVLNNLTNQPTLDCMFAPPEKVRKTDVTAGEGYWMDNNGVRHQPVTTTDVTEPVGTLTSLVGSWGGPYVPPPSSHEIQLDNELAAYCQDKPVASGTNVPPTDPEGGREKRKISFGNKWNLSIHGDTPPTDPEGGRENREIVFSNDANLSIHGDTPPTDPEGGRENREIVFSNDANLSIHCDTPPTDPERGQGRLEQYKFGVGSIHWFHCVPSSRVEEAKTRIESFDGVQNVCYGAVPGELRVLYKSKFRKLSNVFNGPNWIVTHVKNSTMSELATPMYNKTVVPADMLKALNLSKEEEQNIPTLQLMYVMFGMRDALFSTEDQLYTIFTYNGLCALDFYTDPQLKNAKRNLIFFREIPGKIFKMHYTAMIGITTLADGGKIFYPLNFRTAGDQVLVVHEDYIATALSHCTSPKAAALCDIATRLMNFILKKSARQHFAAVGPQNFMRNIPQNVKHQLEVALGEAEKKAIEAEKKALAAEDKARACELEAVNAKLKASETELRLARTELMNKPICTPFTAGQNQRRIGCVHLFIRREHVKKPYVQMRLTQKSDTKHRVSLLMSAQSLEMPPLADRILTLYGGVDVIQARSLLGTMIKQDRDSTSRFLATSEEGGREIVNKVFLPAICDNFLATVVYEPGSEPQLKHVNHLMVETVPQEDRDYVLNLCTRNDPNNALVL